MSSAVVAVRLTAPCCRRVAYVSRVRRNGRASIAVSYLRDPSEFVRNAALECLIGDRRRRYPLQVSRLLRDPQSIVRVTALECLVHYDARSHWRSAAKLLRDSDPLVRAYAAWALGALRAAASARYLKRALSKEKDVAARAGIAEALGRLGVPGDHIAVLAGLMRNRSANVRCFVANSLVGLATKKTRPQIIAILRDALRRERTVAGRECLRKNLRQLQ